LAVSGTLGVLDLAARQGLVNLSEALRRLEGTTFRASPRLIGLIKARESK
jgi:predicted nucleic acid-binding protein